MNDFDGLSERVGKVEEDMLAMKTEMSGLKSEMTGLSTKVDNVSNLMSQHMASSSEASARVETRLEIYHDQQKEIKEDVEKNTDTSVQMQIELGKQPNRIFIRIAGLIFSLVVLMAGVVAGMIYNLDKIKAILN